MSRSSTLAMCMTLCFLAPVQAAIIMVTSDSGGTGGPDCTLRDAITAANTDTPTGGCPAGSGADTIELPADATITLTEEDNQTNGRNGLPSVTSVLTINGNETTVQRDPADDTPAFRILHVSAGGDLVLDGVTIRDGSTTDGGGGILSVGGTVTLTNSTVSGNHGGGIRALGGTLSMIDSTVSGNYGSGILHSGTLTLTNSTVSGNSATFAGGINILGDATLINSIVSGNTAGKEGGGMHVSGAVTLINSTVSGNTSFHDGGGIRLLFGTLTLINSTVSGNATDPLFGIGGGISSHDSTVTLSNSTISGNSSCCDAGGIFTVHNTLSVVHSTVSENSGGIRVFGVGSLWLENSIVANTSSGGDCWADGDTSVFDLGYNIIEDGTCISDPTSSSGDPMLGPLEDNGGPTPTHALREGSPAIDTIPVGDCVVDTDQRGIPRPQGDGCDIGAYEVEPADPCADDDGDGLVTICHAPPGNPGNAHTITVSVNALPKHLAHGDTCGPCADGLPASAGGPAAGSCCITDDCIVVTEEDCAAIGGEYLGDGTRCVGPFDLAQLLGWWGPCEPTDPCHEVDADTNGDIGPFDLAVLLGVWGPCPQ